MTESELQKKTKAELIQGILNLERKLENIYKNPSEVDLFRSDEHIHIKKTVAAAEGDYYIYFSKQYIDDNFTQCLDDLFRIHGMYD